MTEEDLVSLSILAEEMTPAAAETSSLVVYPTWVYGVSTLVVLMLLLWVVTRVNLDR